MRMTVSTRQRAGMAARFYSTDAAAQEAVRRVNRRHGIAARKLVYMICPVDTGFMRDHLRLRFRDGDLSWELGWEEQDFLSEGKPFYVIFVLFGTTKMPARDVLFIGTRQIQLSYRSDVRIELSRALKRRRAA